MRRGSLIAAVLLSGCNAFQAEACRGAACLFTPTEWERLQTLTGLGDPPADRSNRVVGDPAAQKLGQAFYFDPGFSGAATLLDSIRRPAPYARAAQGQPVNVACADCHNPAHGGTDHTSKPNHVSIGAGWYDVNSQPTLNAAFYTLQYWNGRNDSLWSQIVAVSESFVSMNGNRVAIGRRIYDTAAYRTAYEQIFGAQWPLPFSETSADLQARLEPDGQCRLDVGQCPTRCALDGDAKCWPRFPLAGRPGTTAGCQRGSATEPFGDAFDCMAADDQKAVTRTFVNFAKAIASYEFLLVSDDSPFDRFMAAGPDSDLMPLEAQRGAKIYIGKAQCLDCHKTPLFSDSRFRNIGVPQEGEGVPSVRDCPEGAACDCVKGNNCLPWGWWDGLKKLKASGFRRDSEWSDDATDDTRARFYTQNLTEGLKDTWRTPGLRDVALTAPYMHDGSLATLEDVIWYYNEGGAAPDSGNKSNRLQPLNLTAQEQRDLVAFMRALTGAPLPAELTRKP